MAPRQWRLRLGRAAVLAVRLFDIYDYALWGPRVGAPFWYYGYDDIYAGLFGPYDYQVWRATCRRAVLPAPGLTGWRCYAARTAAKSPACRST